MWNAFPKFFEHYSFCFPSFQTGNEQFAKGIPLCLPADARITSTFGGHYDLAAYLVLVIPVFIATIFTIKRKLYKILFSSLTFLSIVLIILTASRISFFAYLIGSMATLIFFKKKKFILPLIVLSVVLLLTFSGSTAKRFMETFRFVSVVTNNQGQIVGQAELPLDLKNKISKNIIANVPSQNLPVGSGYLGLPQIGVQQTTNNAIVQSALSLEQARRLKLENGGVEISTVSGSFLIKKVLVYDISFTTRFQGEWPNAWAAFLKNPLLGSGFSTITLAADNDYLRALGESGLLGLFSFIFIFLLFYIALRETIPKINDQFSRAYLLGISGGIVGLSINAILIDVFESSKVAETFWILFGIAMGILYLYKKEFNFVHHLKQIFTSKPFLIFYLFFLLLVFYLNSTVNFFVANDFTWLKWAATANLSSISHYFIISEGFFYRPLDKTVMFFLYTLFSFQPQGYHIFVLMIHFLVGLGVYVLGLKIFKKRLIAFVAAFIFLFLPSQSQNIFWISTISATLYTFFTVFLLIFWLNFRDKNSLINYILALLFAILSFASYEGAIIILPLIILSDLFVSRVKGSTKTIISYIPFGLITVLYFYIRPITQSISFGGDYSYNFFHTLPNFLVYLGLMTIGTRFTNFYTLSKEALNSGSLIISIIIILILGVFLSWIFIKKQFKNKLFKNENFKWVIFFLSFSFISLVPFLGLNNIFPRYQYLASVGFSLMLSLILFKISGVIKNPKKAQYLFVLLTFILGIFYYYQINLENKDWHEAGRITQRTLGFLRLYYDGKHSNSNFYFVNLPTKVGNAYVFITGIDDGVWFIYRDNSIRIYKLASINQGKEILKNAKQQDKNFIFAFDKNNNIYAVK